MKLKFSFLSLISIIIFVFFIHSYGFVNGLDICSNIITIIMPFLAFYFYKTWVENNKVNVISEKQKELIGFCESLLDRITILNLPQYQSKEDLCDYFDNVFLFYRKMERFFFLNEINYSDSLKYQMNNFQLIDGSLSYVSNYHEVDHSKFPFGISMYELFHEKNHHLMLKT